MQLKAITKTATITSLVLLAGWTGYTTIYFLSPSEIVERRVEQVEGLFQRANNEACSLGRYMQDHQADGGDYLAYCDDMTAEEAVAWGGEFLEKFNN